MRAKGNNRGLRVHATAGTRNVLLGIDSTSERCRDLLGFRIERKGPRARDSMQLHGSLSFEDEAADPAGKGLIQDFQWSDYTAKPKTTYEYTITPVHGTPTSLRERAPVSVEVKTESEDDGTHGIHFNRGASASQAFNRAFPDVTERDFDKPDSPAIQWLSRGLLEGLLAFIGRARGEGWALRGCLYEFTYQPVLQAFKAAHKRGADVKLVVDNIGAGEENRPEIAKAGIKRLVIPRKAPGIRISHNKFVILLRRGRPVAVWTGSTNHTAGGLFGQSNVGHLVTDDDVANTFHEYWTEIATNPARRDFTKWNDVHTPSPEVSGPAGTTVVFSPRTTTEALDRYAKMMSKAEHAVFLTAAFGVSDQFTEVFKKRRKYLRYILMDNKGQTGNQDNTETILQNPFNLVALGDVLEQGELENWHAERLTGLNSWVKYVHTKYMLLDPLSSNPTVLSGSANFSDASTTDNDENMLVIRGDTRAADVYLTEFMRQFTNFAFRNRIDEMTHRSYGPRGARRRRLRRTPLELFLVPDDSWVKPHFKRGSVHEKQRMYFAGRQS